MTLSALMIALLAIFAQFSIPIGPVAVTLQTFVVFLIGALLTPKNAFLTTVLYLVLGLLGAPVFANFNGGLHSFLLPSFGFALSWVPATTLQALYLKRIEEVTTKQLVFSFIINFLMTYLIGLAYMAMIINVNTGNLMNIAEILWIGFLPFIPGDIMKIFVATLLVKRLRNYFKRFTENTF